MKFSKKKTEEFKPFDFTITVENEQEARLLHFIFNMPQKSIENIHNVKFSPLQSITHLDIYSEYSKFFKPAGNDIVKYIDDCIPAEDVLPENTPGKKTQWIKIQK